MILSCTLSKTAPSNETSSMACTKLRELLQYRTKPLPTSRPKAGNLFFVGPTTVRSRLEHLLVRRLDSGTISSAKTIFGHSGILLIAAEAAPAVLAGPAELKATKTLSTQHTWSIVKNSQHTPGNVTHLLSLLLLLQKEKKRNKTPTSLFTLAANDTNTNDSNTIDENSPKIIGKLREKKKRQSQRVQSRDATLGTRGYLGREKAQKKTRL